MERVALLIFLSIAALSTAGAAAAALQLYHREKKRRPGKTAEMKTNLPQMPWIVLTESGHFKDVEKFTHYVARQMGFDNASECPNLCKLANDYLKNAAGWEEAIYAFLAKNGGGGGADELYVKLVEELDKCVLGYFAFHWDHSSILISQALAEEENPKKKLKKMVLEATRKMRFERVTKELKVARAFSTLVDEMKAIGISQCTDVMAPVAHCDRSPVLLLMGGGMGAGKSTILKEILKEPFWLGAAGNAVVVEADAFKESDVIYRAISSRGHHNDMLQTAELVHQSSTDAASSLLVTALNEGRDVIMDGTLSWAPFVEQTVAMVRDVHRRRYRMGVGYKVADDGTITEEYWEPVPGDVDGEDQPATPGRKPYRIELVGVVCDAYLAVIRGIRRAIIMRRAVRVKPQLKSHKRFAGLFKKYCDLVDGARLYSSNSMGSAKLIGWKEGSNALLVEPEEFACLGMVAGLNEDANSVHELYSENTTVCGASSVWDSMVMEPTRASVQQELKSAVQAIEAHA